MQPRRKIEQPVEKKLRQLLHLQFIQNRDSYVISTGLSSNLHRVNVAYQTTYV
jgi:hypothetical protein